MAFDPETLIAAAKTRIEGLSGIGLVHDFRRDVKDEPTARAVWYHEGQGRIHAWHVTLGEPTAQTVRGPGFSSNQPGQITADIRLVVEGVFGINDAAASEKTFRALCWNLQLRMNQQALLTVDVAHQDPFQWDRFGYLVLAGMYSVHYARFSCRYIGRV